MTKTFSLIVFFLSATLFCTSPVDGFQVTKGMFGVPPITDAAGEQAAELITDAGITAVFVPPHDKTITWYQNKGLQVFLTVNVFGGSEAWKKYPDARPITADGTPVDVSTSGICPSHPEWRQDRLQHIAQLITKFSGKNPIGGRIDGIWLDFLRFPGIWEAENPRIPDTCYCDRCLRNFQAAQNIAIPTELVTTSAAAWIRENALYEWVQWKKGQITSFASQVRQEIDRLPAQDRIKFGIFLVPWRKGERQNAVSSQLGQDAFQLARQADIISPMLYHQMVGKDTDWVNEMTGYYKETALAEVWPIIQAGVNGHAISVQEFKTSIIEAGRAGADSLLIYSFAYMAGDKWSALHAFNKPANLIPNPYFTTAEVPITPGVLPSGWQTNPDLSSVGDGTYRVEKSDRLQIKLSRFLSEPERMALTIRAGNEAASWTARLPACIPGEEYLFSAEMYRDIFEDGKYPALNFWGHEYLIDTLLQRSRFQPVRLHLTCPESGPDLFSFISQPPGITFALRNPKLSRKEQAQTALPFASSFFKNNFFPIGVFGAGLNELEQIKKLGMNTVLIGGGINDLERIIKKCLELDLHYIISIPNDRDRLPIFLDQIAAFIKPEQSGFYVNDEPGIFGFPINAAEDIHRLIKEKFPDAPTTMAIVRPQVVEDYKGAADYFMLDQYPVPNRPMTWLSDSMDTAAAAVGTNRIASVVQAFSAPEHGWTRLPTEEEMNCLAWLSIVHGSQGVFVYSYRHIGKTEEGRSQLGRIVKNLQDISPWLVEKNIPGAVRVDMIASAEKDESEPAVHCALKEKGEEVLLICVNTVASPVTAAINAAPYRVTAWRNIDSETGRKLEKNGVLHFAPFEVMVFAGAVE